MTYYCFLCNKEHEDSPTKEHFIPKAINGPEDQWFACFVMQVIIVLIMCLIVGSEIYCIWQDFRTQKF